MRITLELAADVRQTFHTKAIAESYDIGPDSRAKRIDVELPEAGEAWTVGAIIGASGSGKSSVLRAYARDGFHADARGEAAQPWARDRAIIDEVAAAGVTSDARMMALTGVGLGSTPSWLRPYHVLSSGERFRADAARLLLGDAPVIFIDDFTDALNREVARTCAAGVAKAVRKAGKRLVVAGPHDDYLGELSPDWIVDMDGQTLARADPTRGCLRRRAVVAVDVVPVKASAWPAFRDHHYLNTADLHPGSQCFVATWGGRPVAFCAALHVMGIKGAVAISRIVALPDFQGMGFGTRLMEWCADHFAGLGKRVSITASHPAILRYCVRSPRWEPKAVKLAGNKHQGRKDDPKARKTSEGRPVATFNWRGPATAPAAEPSRDNPHPL